MNPFTRAVMDKSSAHPPQEKIVLFPARHSLSPEEEARKRDSISADLAELTGGIGGYAAGPTSSASVDAAPVGQVTSKGNWPGAVAQFRNELTGGTYEPGIALSLLNSRFFLAKAKGAYRTVGSSY